MEDDIMAEVSFRVGMEDLYIYQQRKQALTQEQHEKLMQYLGETSPADWNYLGWLAYWKRKPSPHHYLRDYMSITREEFAKVVGENLPTQIRGNNVPQRERGAIQHRTEQQEQEAPDLAAILAKRKADFRTKVEESDWYQNNPLINKPFIWRGTISELARALSESEQLLEYYVEEKQREEVYIADVADSLFVLYRTGNPITHQQLYDAAKRIDIKFTRP